MLKTSPMALSLSNASKVPATDIAHIGESQCPRFAIGVGHSADCVRRPQHVINDRFRFVHMFRAKPGYASPWLSPAQ